MNKPVVLHASRPALWPRTGRHDWGAHAIGGWQGCTGGQPAGEEAWAPADMLALGGEWPGARAGSRQRKAVSSCWTWAASGLKLVQDPGSGRPWARAGPG